MKKIAILLLGMSACLAAASAIAEREEIAPTELSRAIANCESCHGPKGDSTAPSVPRLNGQQTTYIAAQLQKFRDPTWADPHAINAMWNIATHTGDAMVAELANYFARQAPTAARASNPALAAEGAKLFAQGAPAQNIPACISCHGAHGEGATGPRLAGQHGAYLTHAMEVLQLALRESDTMHPRLNNIEQSQIEALAAYLAND